MTSNFDRKTLIAYYQNPEIEISQPKTVETGSDTFFDNYSNCITYSLRKLTGRVEKELLKPPVNDSELVSILEANSLSYRYLSLSSLDLNGYFGYIIVHEKKTKIPYTIYYEATRSFRFNGSNLNIDVLTKETLENLENDCIEIFSPLPENLNTQKLAKYAVKSTESGLYYVLLFGILVSLVQLLIPIISSTLVATSIPNGDIQYSFQLSLILLIASASALLFKYYQVRFISAFNSIVLSKLQVSIWQKLASLPVLFIQRYPQQELVQRAGSLVQIQALIGTQLIPAIISLVFGIFYFILMLFYGGNFAYVAICCYIIFSLTCIPLFKRQTTLQKDYNNISAHFAAQVQNALSGISLLKATDTEAHFINTIITRLSQLTKRELQISYVDSFSDLISLLAQPLIYIAVFTYFTFTTTSKTLDPGALSQLVGFLTSLAGFNSTYTLVLTLISSNFVKAAAKWDYVQPILQSPREPLGVTPVDSLKGQFEFDNVSFSYSKETRTIVDLDLIIRPGIHTAITGPSGSGKSTILRLCTGTIRPDSGLMRVDGVDYQQLNLKSLRLQIGIVTQQVNLPQATIRDVLDPLGEYPKSRLLEYLDYACIRKEIEELPMGLDTILTPGATNISGGQRQRLLLARALIREPNVLFLDEATSALDIEAQRAISEYLDSSNITRISIAHRLETIKNADSIIILENGCLTQQGSYDDLISQEGFFKNAFSEHS